jgi:cobyrinic acid a,c-diamide synthase
VAERLFSAEDAEGTELAQMGLRSGSVMGSFAHVIALA